MTVLLLCAFIPAAAPTPSAVLEVYCGRSDLIRYPHPTGLLGRCRHLELSIHTSPQAYPLCHIPTVGRLQHLSINPALNKSSS